jgi:hypothetical protein
MDVKGLGNLANGLLTADDLKHNPEFQLPRILLTIDLGHSFPPTLKDFLIIEGKPSLKISLAGGSNFGVHRHICNSPAEDSGIKPFINLPEPARIVDCPRCGHYGILMNPAAHIVEAKKSTGIYQKIPADKIYLYSSLIRRRNNKDNPPLVTYEDLEKANKLITMGLIPRSLLRILYFLEDERICSQES